MTRRRGALARNSVLLGALASVFACGAPEIRGPGFEPLPVGRLVTAGESVLLPGLGWRPSEGVWIAERRPQLLLWLAEPAAEIEIEIEIDRDFDTAAHVSFLLDGRPLAEVRPALQHERVTWRVAAARPLSAGLHTLELSAASGARLRAARLLGAGPPLELARYSDPRWRPVAELLERGVVTVSGQERAAAIVFTAAGRLELPTRAATLVRVLARNGSRAPATFRLATGHEPVSVELAPGDSRVLEATTSPGLPTALGVDAAAPEPDQGPYVWAAPHLERAQPPKPPVVLITLDTFRRDLLATYRGDDPKTPTFTPRLDELAATATVFTRAYATSPWTLPSHASIATGLYPIAHGAGVWTAELVVPRATLAERLRAGGYVTVGAAGGFFCGSSRLMARGFDRYLDPEGLATPGSELNDWLDTVAIETSGNPFFLFVNLFDAHFPYRPANTESAQTHESPDPFLQRLLDGDGAAFRRLASGEITLSERARERLLAAYRAGATEVDRQVGRIFDRLRSAGLWDRALVVVAADHGEQFGENGLYGHSHRLTPELVEIPLLVKWPGQRRGEKVGELASLVDIFHTVLSVAGLGPVRQLESLDLRDLDRLRQRRKVRIEEHEAPLHDLFEGARLGAHLVASQELDWRAVRWEAGVRCWGRSGSSWHQEACPGDVLPLAPSELGPAPREHGLDEESRRALEALGYITPTNR